MGTLRIAEVAERTGVPATTLRYYEDIGLLAPAPRAANGYRTYTEQDVERLRFITRAKQLDLSLDDLRDLVRAWDVEDCGDVQNRMAGVVTERLTQAQQRLADLMALTAQLRTAADRLSSAPAHSGSCDSSCACATAGDVVAGGPTFVPLTRRAPDGPEALGCTLAPAAMRGRVEDWQEVLDHAVGREPIAGGTAVLFDHGADRTGRLARLAAAEHGCCGFFDFTIAITGDGVRFEVRAPAEALDVVTSIFGPVGPGASATG